jgi:inner membrane protein YidH
VPPADHPDHRSTPADERTLPAWLRTGPALVAGGVAVAESARPRGPLGRPWLALPVTGVVVTVAGAALVAVLSPR